MGRSSPRSLSSVRASFSRASLELLVLVKLSRVAETAAEGVFLDSSPALGPLRGLLASTKTSSWTPRQHSGGLAIGLLASSVCLMMTARESFSLVSVAGNYGLVLI